MATTTAKAESLQPLVERLDQLEQRVSRLEVVKNSPHPHGPELEEGKTRDEVYEKVTVSSFWLKPARATESGPTQPVLPAAQLDAAHGIFGTVARAVLALAGAYLLRAGAESGWLSRFAAILAAFAYALAWIIAAGKTANRGPANSTIYALTASIVFFGLVWENAVRSALLPPPIAALLMVAYLCAGQFVAWICNRREIAAVTTASVVLLSLVLFIATHHLIPFDITLLCAAAASEFAACRGRWLAQRWMAALPANFAIFVTAWIWSQSAALPEGYAPFGPSSVLGVQLALVFVYLASMGYRTMAAQVVVNAFDIGQNAVAIGLLILGEAVMAPASGQRLVAGVICFFLAKSSYVASILLARKGAHRNASAYGVFGLALQMTAMLIVVPPHARVFAWCGVGVGVALLGNRERQTALRLQAPVYLFAAALASGLIQASGQSLTSLVVPRADHLIAMLITTAAVASVYKVTDSGHARKARTPALFCAALLASCVLGLGAIAIKAVSGALSFAASLRIGLICLAALGSARWGSLIGSPATRPEWVWLSYPLMLYGAWRIIVEDLPGGSPGVTALSLLFYGGTLLLLTPILRSRHPA